MATVGENLKASVTFGGNIDPSWTRSLADMEKGAAGLVKKVSKLTSDQQKLAEKIRKASEDLLSGSRKPKLLTDLKAMKSAYQALGDEIGRATTEQKQLGREMARARRNEKWKGRGLAAGKMAGLGMLGVAGAALLAPLALNRETAEKNGLAKSYGLDAPSFLAMGGLARSAGLNDENVGDLFENYKNKLGTFDPKKPDKSAIGQYFPELGFHAGDMAGMDNQQQVTTLLDRLAGMKDVQRSSFIADELFGGEGNKFVTFLRSSNSSMSELLDKQKKYNLVTDEGAEGASRGNAAVSNLWTVLTSAAAEVAGILGGELAPSIESVAANLAAWLRDGAIDRVKNFIKTDLIPGVLLVGKALFTLAEGMVWLATKLGKWFGRDPKEEAQQKQTLLTQVAAGNSSLPMVQSMADDLDLGDWFRSQVNTPDTVAALRQAWGSTSDVAGRQKKLADIVPVNDTSAGELMAEFAHYRASASKGEGLSDGLRNPGGAAGRGAGAITYAPTNHITVNTQPGQDEHAIASNIVSLSRGKMAFPGLNTLGDAPAL